MRKGGAGVSQPYPAGGLGGAVSLFGNNLLKIG